MRNLVLTGLACAAFASTALAQTPPISVKGLYQRTSTGATSRGSNGSSAGQMLTRIEYDSHRGWGVANDALTVHQIWGAQMVIQDQQRSTREWYKIQGYGEDKAKPNFPDKNDNFLSTGQMQLPTGSGAGAWLISVTFKTAAKAPVGEDIFLGIEVPKPPANWPGDGVSLHINLGFQPSASFTTYDLAGPAGTRSLGAAGSYGYSWVNNANPLLNSPRQYRIDPFLTGGGGNAVAQTNQKNYTVSNSPNWTSSMFSALSPDIAGAANTGRADNIGYSVTHTQWKNHPVVFTLTPGFFPRNIPLPKPNTGVICADVRRIILLHVAVANASGRADVVLPIPAAARKLLKGSVVWQAFGVDVKNFLIRAGDCVRQKFD